MPKTLLQMDERSRAQLRDIPESGMSYYLVMGHIGEYDEDAFHIIAGDFLVIPLRDSPYFSYEDIQALAEWGNSGREARTFDELKEQVIPSRADETVNFKITAAMTSGLPSPLPTQVTLPQGYQPAFGALHLLGTTSLQFPTNFYRFLGTPIDPRLTGTSLSSGTYLSTTNDHGYANTGFGAVARYALPIPVPACHQFIYQLPVGTVLKVGTVIPQYGQAGGGVEVQLTQDEIVTPLQYRKLDEY